MPGKGKRHYDKKRFDVKEIRETPSQTNVKFSLVFYCRTSQSLQ